MFIQLAWFELFTIAVGVLTSRRYFADSLKPYPKLYSLSAAIAAILAFYGLVKALAFVDTSRRYVTTEWSQYRKIANENSRREAQLIENSELQTELKRLACYRGLIDGVWGSGSSQALGDFLLATGHEKEFGISVAVDEAKRLLKSSPEGVCSLSHPVNQSTTRKRYKQASNAHVSACRGHFFLVPYWKDTEECTGLNADREALAKKLLEMKVQVPGDG